MAFVYSDTGRPSTVSNDCVTIALSLFLGIPYVEARDIMLEEMGRSSRGGVVRSKWIKAIEARGAKEFDFFPQITLQALIRRFPDKTMMVAVHRHVFCVKNGEVMDTNRRYLTDFVERAFIA